MRFPVGASLEMGCERILRRTELVETMESVFQFVKRKWECAAQ